MNTGTKTKTVKTPAPSRTRVKELTIARLEALTEKQRVRLPRSRRLPSVSAAEKARQADEAQRTALTERRRKKKPLATQITDLTEHLCLMALLKNRPSLKPGFFTAVFHRAAERMGNSGLEGLPPRVRETGPTMRSLDRAEALLTRLVWRGAEAQARREMEASQGMQETDGNK